VPNASLTAFGKRIWEILSKLEIDSWAFQALESGKLVQKAKIFKNFLEKQKKVDIR
jgi:hypothetical protein